MDKFTERFNEILNETGLSGALICKQLGIHPPTLVKYKKGSGMSTETLYKFCYTFNVSADWLLGLSDEKYIKNRGL